VGKGSAARLFVVLAGLVTHYLYGAIRLRGQAAEPHAQ